MDLVLIAIRGKRKLLDDFMKNKILVTGGAGYVGTHTCIALHQAGYDVVIYDNLSNSSREAVNRVSNIKGLLS